MTKEPRDFRELAVKTAVMWFAVSAAFYVIVIAFVLGVLIWLGLLG